MNLRLAQFVFCSLFLLVLLGSRAGLAQAPGSPARADFAREGVEVPPDAVDSPGPETRTPAEIEDTFLQASGIHAHFEGASKMSDPAKMFARRNQIASVPHFTNSFAFQGKTFPFTVVGEVPQRGQTAHIATQIIPLSFYFEGYADEQGNPIVLDIEPHLPAIINSPNFRPASYATGLTQFADAVQRAQFFRVMSPEWHTLLDTPSVLRKINIEVPRGSATLYRMRSSGAIFAVVDAGFFISQLNTILQFLDLDVTGLPIALTSNVFLAPKADIRHCCVLGFHTSFDAGESENLKLVQTFLWASWIDPGIFGSTVADVTALSHEISEWMNDPFSINIVPDWQFPYAGNGCQSNLETGDPMSAFPNAGYPVTIEGVTYHPQNETLLQWFQRKTPSDAFDHAYSFPDETLLTSSAQSCAAR